MSNTLDFNKIKKKYLNVTLADEQNTTIMIGTPTKAIMNDLMSLKSSLETMTDDASVDTIGELYEACAKVMSRNKAGKKIEKEHLEQIFDFEDILIFFNAYMEFVSVLASEKN